MQSLELKVPPVAATVLFAGGMWLSARAAPALAFAIPGRIPMVIAVATIGLGIFLAAGLAFHSAKTTPNPIKPGTASTLVRTGIYRWSRNPMYVSLLALLLALAVFLANALPFVLLPAFMACMNRFQIVPEERALLAKFGADYAAYLDSVRRWL